MRSRFCPMRSSPTRSPTPGSASSRSPVSVGEHELRDADARAALYLALEVSLVLALGEGDDGRTARCLVNPHGTNRGVGAGREFRSRRERPPRHGAPERCLRGLRRALPASRATTPLRCSRRGPGREQAASTATPRSARAPYRRQPPDEPARRPLHLPVPERFACSRDTRVDPPRRRSGRTDSPRSPAPLERTPAQIATTRALSLSARCLSHSSQRLPTSPIQDPFPTAIHHSFHLSALARTVGQLEHELRVVALAAHDRPGSQLHGRVARELLAPSGVELGRRAGVRASPVGGRAVELATGDAQGDLVRVGDDRLDVVLAARAPGPEGVGPQRAPDLRA